MTLGELLKQAREKNGYSIRKLSKLVGISHTTIYKYESGLYEPRISHLKWLAQALDLTLLELIERI